MPIVTIEITREGASPGASSVTAEEKPALGRTRAAAHGAEQGDISRHRGVEMKNGGWGGLPVAEHQRRQRPV
jgi:4-oxalocrotonate tautomerase